MSLNTQPANDKNENNFTLMLQALLQKQAFPFSYPTEEEPTLIQTHASAVLLTPQYVYKLKKPRDFGFFDYSTPSLRRHFCQQEVILNAPLAPEIYQGIAPVIQSEDAHFRFGPTLTPDNLPSPGDTYQEGKVVDYAVVMLRLPEEATLFSLLHTDQATPALMEEIAQMVAHFHTTTSTNKQIEHFGSMEVIRGNWEENFEQMHPYIGRTIDEATYNTIVRYIRQFMEQRESLFQQRITQGHIRDCHGDLRLQHVYILPATNGTSSHRVLLLDRIEFNERFRYSDVASEVAFLAMELDSAQRTDLSTTFIKHYIAETQDTTLAELLPFYACYRACVRGKVTSFLLDDPGITKEQREQATQEAAALFKLAARYTGAGATKHPQLIMVGGVMGTGKSALAQALQKQLNWSLLSSDVVRKQLANLSATQPQEERFAAGIYDPSWNQKTYQALGEKAQRWLQQGSSVILDASFSRRADRQMIAREASRHGADVIFLECVCPRAVAIQRLAQRWQRRVRDLEKSQHMISAASDGRPELYDEQSATWEAFDASLEPQVRHMVITTTSPLPATTKTVLKGIQSPLDYL